MNPVVALFVGWAIGGETLDARTLGASAVIVAGVALIVIAVRNGARIAQPHPEAAEQR